MLYCFWNLLSSTLFLSPFVNSSPLTFVASLASVFFSSWFSTLMRFIRELFGVVQASSEWAKNLEIALLLLVTKKMGVHQFSSTLRVIHISLDHSWSAALKSNELFLCIVAPIILRYLIKCSAGSNLNITNLVFPFKLDSWNSKLTQTQVHQPKSNFEPTQNHHLWVKVKKVWMNFHWRSASNNLMKKHPNVFGL